MFLVVASLTIIAGIHGMPDTMYGSMEPWKLHTSQYVYGPMQYLPVEHQGRTFDDFNVDKFNPLKWFSNPFSKGSKKHDSQMSALYKMVECLILKKSHKECEKLLADSKELFVIKKPVQHSSSSTTIKPNDPENSRTTEKAPLTTTEESAPQSNEEETTTEFLSNTTI